MTDDKKKEENCLICDIVEEICESTEGKICADLKQRTSSGMTVIEFIDWASENLSVEDAEKAINKALESKKSKKNGQLPTVKTGGLVRSPLAD